jgi:hypothetical protein
MGNYAIVGILCSDDFGSHWYDKVIVRTLCAMTSIHISAALTYIIWHEECLCSVSVL